MAAIPPARSLAVMRIFRRAITAIAAAVLVAAAPAAASEADQGAQVLQQLQAGKTTCTKLTTTDFDHVGEYVMERMLGSASLHQAMNQRMTTMMGASGETRAHVYMGQRFSGCATGGAAPAGVGAMMGFTGAGAMMGGVAGTPAAGIAGTQVPTTGVWTATTGGMMGYRDRHHDRWSGGAVVMAIFMGLLLVVLLAALIAWRPWARRTPDAPTALQTLEMRFARGEIDHEEFDRARKALGGSG